MHVDLLACTRDSPSPLVQYACAAAWFLHEERHRSGTIAAVCKKALAVDQAFSADPVRWLSEVTGRDCDPELRKANLKTAFARLEAVVADAAARAPWKSKMKPAG